MDRNTPTPAAPHKPRGDVEVALDDLGTKFVSEVFTRDDGTRVLFRFKSKVNRRNGTVQLTYEETEGGEGEGGEVNLPEVVKIVVAMFQGGELVELEAKLRYGVDKGKVAFTLVVPGLEKIERDQFRRIGEDVRNSTNTPVFYTT